MQVSSGTKNNSSPNARTILHHRNGVVQWCSLGGNGYLALSILKPGDNQTANTKPGLFGKHHTRPLLWCPQCMLSTPG
ncbi:hypothetical protein TNCV_285351 [Trichonephila clavipes]|nr:hypothetical protein TNCV_285351 [Trichonephila clavipes]